MGDMAIILLSPAIAVVGTYMAVVALIATYTLIAYVFTGGA